MRWFVEISPLGASEGQKQKWCLEAPGWQPALKQARSHRGEEGPLGGFSIELLDDGARAVDPATRLRYVIREAPDSAPLTHTKEGPIQSPASKVEPAKIEPTPAKIDPAKIEPAPAKIDPAPAKIDPAKIEPAPAKTEPAPAKIDPAKPASNDEVEIPVDEDEPAEMAPLPDYQVLQAREENPNDRSPLTYREYVYAVAESTSDAEVERLLHARFGAVKRELENVTQGRFVNLAIFDHAFTGKPRKPPRATLAWKDWRGGPEIRFPAAGRASVEPQSFAAPTSFSNPIPAPSVALPVPASLAPSTAVAPTQPAPGDPPTQLATRPTEPAPTSVKTPAPVVVVVPPAPDPSANATLPTIPSISSAPATPMVSTEPSREIVPADAATAKSEPFKPSEPAKTPAVEVVAPPVEVKAAPVVEVVAPPVEVKAAPVVEVVAPPAEVKAASPVEAKSAPIEPPVEVKIAPAPEPAPRPADEPPAARSTSVPVSAAPKTMPAVSKPAAAAPPPPSKREAYIPPVKTAAQAGKRIAGDELIAELFEACGDLQFLRDSLEGADFVLSLALEKLPSEVGLVSLFDINRREFVVIRQAGGPRSVVLARLPERAGLAQPAMRKKSAIVVADASKEPRALDDRFRTLGIELLSLMVAPVEVSGRYLGLIELCNPVDGKPFTEGDGHALTYIGEQYAEFVAERGVLLDPEAVIERHQKR